MSKLVRRIAALASVVLIALLAWTVWPTRYRYDHAPFAGELSPVRIDRFTGHAEYLVLGRWLRLGQQGSARPTEPTNLSSELPTDALDKLVVRGVIDDVGQLRAEIHNGSEWTITEVEVVLGDVDYQVTKAQPSLAEVAKAVNKQDEASIALINRWHEWQELARTTPLRNERLIREVVHPISPKSVASISVNVGWKQAKWKISKCFGRLGSGH